jgi:hypothetical protein
MAADSLHPDKRSTCRLAAEGVVGAGPGGQRIHPGVAAAAAGDGGGVAAGLPPPARPLVAPHQVGGISTTVPRRLTRGMW